jgi:hypothetical protein
VSVLPLEPRARRDGSLAIVILPNLIVNRFARLRPERAFLEDVAFVIAIQLYEPDFLRRIQSVGQDDQDFSFFRFHNGARSI